MYYVRHRYPAMLMVLIVGVALTGLFLACDEDDDRGASYDPGDEPGPGEVFMQSYSFNPESLSVAVGTEVTWTNKSGFTHTVTSGTPGNPLPGPLQSGNVAVGLTYTYTFTQAGTYPYFCEIHADSNMVGVVVVD